MDDIQTWWIALGFGLLVVALFSWVRFDEPSYSEQSEFFSIYKPRFATSRSSYYRAKAGYLTLIILMYLALSLAPNLVVAIAKSDILPKDKAIVPIVIAAAIVGLQHVPGIRDFERNVRGILHSFGQIPDGVRRTVSQLQSSEFDFNVHREFLQSAGHGDQLIDGDLDALLSSPMNGNHLIHDWYRVGCILDVLSESNREKLGIDRLFFSYYRTELESIAALHTAIGIEVREHWHETRRSAAARPDLNPHCRLRQLRDRLYTLVACGLRSSIRSDAQLRTSLNGLGFNIIIHPTPTPPIWHLIFLSLAVVLVASLVTATISDAFWQHALKVLPEKDLQSYIGFPKTTPEMFLRSWETALYYFAAILAAMYIRAGLIRKRKWFDLNDTQRHRPVLRYVGPVLFGTAVGYATLTGIILLESLCDPTLPDKDLGRLIVAAAAAALVWAPLATIIGVMVLSISDTDMRSHSFAKTMKTSLVCAAIMFFAGYLGARLDMRTQLAGVITALQADRLDQQQYEKVRYIATQASFVISAYIALFSFLLCGVVQCVEKASQSARNFTRKSLRARDTNGPRFLLRFTEASRVVLTPVRKDSAGQLAAELEGDYQQLPEGTVVYWTSSSGERDMPWGDFALITSQGDSVIYEGYDTEVSARPKLTAQIERHLPRAA